MLSNNWQIISRSGKPKLTLKRSSKRSAEYEDEANYVTYVTSHAKKMPDEMESMLLNENTRKLERKTRRKKKELRGKEEIDKYKKHWMHDPPSIIPENYLAPFERSLVIFFRSGYERYWKEGQPASDTEIIDFIKELFTKYRLLISGGYILENTGLSKKASSKPSIDIDIYVPHHTPERYPEFYDTMAKLFNCDIDESSGKPLYKVNRFKASRRSGKGSFFIKNKIYSVFKHERNVDGVYAEMDLVRPMEGFSPEYIIRNFDLSICMNWYDGNQLYAMDLPAILKQNTGYLHPGYNHLFLGAKNQYGTPHEKSNVTRDRVLKYLLRGYRISYMDLHRGKIIEIHTQDLTNAVERLQRDKRNKYYKEHPNERPDDWVYFNNDYKTNRAIRELSGINLSSGH